MKRVLIVLLIVLLTFSLSGCNEKIEPLESIDISSYDVLYESDEYKIYMLKEISEWQHTIGIPVEELEGRTCYLGITQKNAYVVLYEGDYYSLQNGVKLGLFHTDDLIEQGVGFQCHDDKE